MRTGSVDCKEEEEDEERKFSKTGDVAFMRKEVSFRYPRLSRQSPIWNDDRR